MDVKSYIPVKDRKKEVIFTSRMFSANRHVRLNSLYLTTRDLNVVYI